MVDDDATTERISPAVYGGVMAVLVAVGAALRLVGIDKSLYYDEMWATDLYVGEPVLLLRTAYRATQPPLHAVLMHAWNSVFGDSVVSVRVPSLLFGLGAIVLTGSVARLFRGRSAGLVAAGVMALSSNAIWWSQAARQYSMGYCLAALTVLTFHRTCERSGRARFAAWALTLFAFQTTHFYAVAFLPPLLVGALVLPREPGRRLRLAAVTAAAGMVPVATWLMRTVLGTLITAKVYLRDFDLDELWRLYCWWMPFGSAVTGTEWFGTNDGPRVVVRAIFAAALVAGWTLAVRRRRPGAPSGWWLCAWTLCTPALFVAIDLAGKDRFFIERSGLLAMPFVFATLGCVLSPRSRPLQGGTVILALALAFATWTQTSRPPTGVDGRPLPDSRALARFLEEEARDDFDRRTVITTVQLSIAHATPLAEEARLLAADETELASARHAIMRTLGDGSLGRWAIARIESSFADLEAWKARRRAAVRFPVVYGLENGHLGRQLARQARTDGVVYLVARPAPPDHVLAAIAEKTAALEEIGGFEGLRVWRVRPLP